MENNQEYPLTYIPWHTNFPQCTQEQPCKRWLGNNVGCKVCRKPYHPNPQPVRVAITTLFNTGLSDDRTQLLLGSEDPHYTVISSPDTSTPPPPTPAIVTNLNTWLVNTASSQWISVKHPNGGPNGWYRYRTTFDLTGFDLATVSLSISVAFDNLMDDILLNGSSYMTQLFDQIFGPFGTGYTQWHSNTLQEGFIEGENSLDFVVNNTGTYTGFRAEISGTAVRL